MANNLLERLEGLVSRFEEVSTLITDPSVIADQKRYVKLTKEYKDLGKIVDARKEYVGCLQNISDAKEMLAMRLCVMHNLYFYNKLMEKIRNALDNDTFDAFRCEYSEKLSRRI